MDPPPHTPRRNNYDEDFVCNIKWNSFHPDTGFSLAIDHIALFLCFLINISNLTNVAAADCPQLNFQIIKSASHECKRRGPKSQDHVFVLANHNKTKVKTWIVKNRKFYLFAQTAAKCSKCPVTQIRCFFLTNFVNNDNLCWQRFSWGLGRKKFKKGRKSNLFRLCLTEQQHPWV